MNHSIINAEYTKILDALSDSEESISSVAKKIGVSQTWLNRLANGGFSSPGIDKIILLEAYLFPKDTDQLDMDVNHSESIAA